MKRLLIPLLIVGWVAPAMAGDTCLEGFRSVGNEVTRALAAWRACERQTGPLMSETPECRRFEDAFETVRTTVESLKETNCYAEELVRSGKISEAEREHIADPLFHLIYLHWKRVRP